MKKYILSIDQGTTSSRAILFDKNANIVAVSQKEFTQFFPQDGWVEHNPKEIWATQSGVIQEVVSSASILPKEIAAIGITNQRETTVLWNKNTGEPIYNAIVWQDRRTAKYCEKLVADGKAKLIQKKTGLVVDAYFSATKIKWILDNVPNARRLAEKGDILFGTIDTWLIWQLTRGKTHATDYSNASRTMVFNIIEQKWDDELLKLFDIPKSILPKVLPSSADYGYVDEDLIPGQINIAGVAGDQQAATFGQACLKPGMAKNTYGTGCFTLLNIGREIKKVPNGKTLTTIAWGRKNHVTYAIEGSVFIGGAVVQWLRDGLEIVKKSSEIEHLATKVEDNGGVYLVPAFVGLGAPHWDPYARGTIIGITRGVNKAHIARAALEAIAFQSYDVLMAMKDTAELDLKELRVDGGASRNDLLMQFQADILGKPVVRPVVTETTALGVAYLAGLFVEFWDSAEEIVSKWKIDKVFEPKIANEAKEELLYNWHNAVERSKQWIHEK